MKALQPKVITLAIVSTFAAQHCAYAEENKLTTNKIEVISTTPLQGVGLPVERVPANIQSVAGEEMQRQNNLSISDYMGSSMLGVNVNEVQNNPYQPNVNYRGFTASPLLGTPQGLSVFYDGVRINEPFGDVVNWDLIPLNALAGMNLIPGSNPVFGLNTLGGALSLQTKSGRTHPGGGVEVYGGSWGRIAGSGEFGGVLQNGVDVFVAGNLFHEQGWRDFSPTDVRQGFAKLGWQGEKTDANLSLTVADNELVGNGLVQKEFLDNISYDAINTKPDITDNQMAFLNFNLNHYFNDDVALGFNTYYRHARTKTLNGDVNDDVLADDGIVPDFYAPDCTGATDPEVQCGGALNRSRSSREGFGFTTQLTFNQDLFGYKNQLITGLGFDYGKTRFKQSTELGNLNQDRGVDGVGEFNDEAEVKLRAVSRTYSLFATDTISLSDMYHLTLSGRYNYTQVRNKDGLIPKGDPESLTESFNYNRFNPAIGLAVTPSKDFSFYGSYNEGSRAPTAIELGCAFQDLDGDGQGDTPCRLPNAMAGDPPLKKVVSKTFEAGVRGKLTSDLGYTASVYRTQNTDDIQFIASNPNGQGNFKNVGKTRRQGLDLGLNGGWSNFRWNVGYSYVRATYQSSFGIANQVNTSAEDTNADGDPDTIRVRSGDYLAGIPKHQFKLRGEWQALPNWTIGTNVVAFSSQYSFGNENNKDQGKGAKVRGYTVVNLDTRYGFADTGWELFGRINNVFDKEYYSAGMLGESFFDATGQFEDGENERSFLVAPGAPRAGWIGVRYNFGGAKKSAVDND
ncbi:MAG TPA: TonB-dependent receptor [Methylophilus sp.]|nr:TonB-dependent receptor [Methylophilus sp.]HQQ32638.1 TonB-dependent receptor [Methylophilus sp.]